MNWCGMPLYATETKQPRPGWCGAILPDTSLRAPIADMPVTASFAPEFMPGMRFSSFCEQGIHRLLAGIEAVEPTKMRLFLAALFILIMSFASHAAASAQAMSGNGLLNGLYNHIAGDTTPFFANSFNIADMIFGGVGTMAVMISLANYLGEYRTFSGCGHTVLRLVLQIALPWTFLKIAENVLSLWSTVATNVGSYIIGAQDMNLTPDGIFKTGAGLAGAMLKHVAQSAFGNALARGINLNAGMPYWITGILAVFCALILFVTFTLLAVEMLVAFAQGYISLSVGAFNLGWSASKATSPFAMAYWGLVQSAMTRIIITMSIIGIGLTEARDWITQLNNLEVMNPDLLGSNILALLQIPMLGVALLYIATQVTNFASAQLSGRPVMSANSILGGGGAAPSQPPAKPQSSGNTTGSVRPGPGLGGSASRSGSTTGTARGGSGLPVNTGYHRW
jgi:hypothetical protein